MRGQRATLPPRKTEVDVLITAARYEPETGELRMAQGYEPIGQVWSDIRLYTREDLIERLKAGRHVGFGGNVRLATDFEVRGKVGLHERDGGTILLAEGRSSDTDDLGVPFF